ncbi:MAG: hypothetical protein D4R84_03645, partial [Rhodocyclaceae bacterium]
GYPRKLKGPQIPLPARLFAVIDVYDALTTDRVYHTARSHTEAFNKIRCWISHKSARWFSRRSALSRVVFPALRGVLPAVDVVAQSERKNSKEGGAADGAPFLVCGQNIGSSPPARSRYSRSPARSSPMWKTNRFALRARGDGRSPSAASSRE